MCVIDMGTTVVGAVTVTGGVGVWMGDDGGVLRRVDGNMLETEDIVESVGDGGGDSRDGDGSGGCRRDTVVGAVRGTNLPNLSRRSEAATVDGSSCDGGQRKVSYVGGFG
jgi:hypothetical protein